MKQISKLSHCSWLLDSVKSFSLNVTILRLLNFIDWNVVITVLCKIILFIRNIATALVKLSFNIRLKLFNDTKWITTITKTKTGASESFTPRHFFLLISGVTSEQFCVLKATNIIKSFWDDVRSQLLIKRKACNLHVKDW